MTTRMLLFLALATLATACSTSDTYQVPDSIGYATIEPMRRPRGVNEEFAYIQSINRKEISSWGRLTDKPIDLAVGVQKLHVVACQDAVTLLGTLSLWGPTWHCAEAILRLDVVPGLLYQLKAKVNRDKDTADIWIEIAESGETVAGPIRVIGLD